MMYALNYKMVKDNKDLLLSIKGISNIWIVPNLFDLLTKSKRARPNFNLSDEEIDKLYLPPSGNWSDNDIVLVVYEEAYSDSFHNMVRLMETLLEIVGSHIMEDACPHFTSVNFFPEDFKDKATHLTEIKP